MILVYTSVWVSHFRHKNFRLENLLLEDFVYCHSVIIGELACGNLRNRDEILNLLKELPAAKAVTDQDILIFIEKHRLMGKGLSLIDIHLLVSATLSGLLIWTEDQRLHGAARQLGIAYS